MENIILIVEYSYTFQPSMNYEYCIIKASFRFFLRMYLHYSFIVTLATA